jgi:hypothetical protein
MASRKSMPCLRWFNAALALSHSYRTNGILPDIGSQGKRASRKRRSAAPDFVECAAAERRMFDPAGALSFSSAFLAPVPTFFSCAGKSAAIPLPFGLLVILNRLA